MSTSRTFCVALVSLTSLFTSSRPVSGAVDFTRDIQPILADKCVRCHGAETRKAGLRLDLRSDALQGGDEGPVLVPGKSSISKLVLKITESDPAKRMPREGDPLTPDQIATVRQWIDEGASWPEVESSKNSRSGHWAFQSIQRPELPKLSRTVPNPIDAFVLARLEKERIRPSPEADRHTLIRRLSLDLLGLPPSAEQVEQFTADKRPDAYEHLVDTLLASPHFGERWARHWLDMARYADSDGYEKDRARPYAYLYRDWVIRAINRDLPFDQFSIEQLAGDLLPDPTHDQLVATGFHRQTLTNTEGGTDQEEFRCKATVDRVSTTATVWLGVTMGCAECHSHKYDPFTQREFYQMFAFYNDASEKNVSSPQPEELAAYNKVKAAWDVEQAKLKGALDAYAKDSLPKRFADWTAGAHGETPVWRQLKPTATVSSAGATLRVDKENVVVSEGKLPDRDVYAVEAETDLERISGVRLEAIDDPAPKKGPGRAQDGNFVLTGFKVSLVKPGSIEGESIELASALADHSQKNFPVENALKFASSSGWAVAPKANESHTAIFETKQDVTISKGSKLVFTLEHQYKTAYLLQRFRLSVTDAKRPLKLDKIPDEISAILAKVSSERTKAEMAKLEKYHREQVDPEARKMQAALDAHTGKAPKFPDTFAATMAVEPGGRKTQVHIRGNFLDKGQEVKAATPSVLNPLHARTEKPDRLDLAQWLFDPANPLTARVAVNHVWKNLFGRGLVATVDDFGTRGDKPSHPELLDWLAGEYPRLGWSRKAFIKLIVTSATYRQASLVRQDLESRDPLNTLLARQNRLRMDAETVRDACLSSSGLLAGAVGGPSVRPPLPPDIAALGYANSVKWVESKGADKHRRGIYIFFQRTVPYPMLMTFDAPDSNATCTRRERSNTPLQALTLLNDPEFFECARALGVGMADVPTSDPVEKLRVGFLQCTARPPTAQEQARLLELFQAQKSMFESAPEHAASVFGSGEAASDTPEKAAWVALARVILNLDEFITRN